MENTSTKTGIRPWLYWLIPATLYFIQVGLLISPSTLTHEMRTTYGISRVELSFYSSLFLYPYVLMQIPAGLLFDHFDYRKLVRLSGLLLVIGTLITAVTNNYGLVCVARTLMGLGGSFCFVAVIYIGRCWFPIVLFSLMLGLSEAVASIAQMSVPALIHTLKHQQPWQHIYLESSIFIFILIAFTYLMKHRRIKEHHTSVNISHDLKTILGNKQIWLLGFYVGFAYAHYVTLINLWGVSFMRHHYELMTVQAIFSQSIDLLGFMLGCIFLGYIARFVPDRKLILACALLELILCYASNFLYRELGVERYFVLFLLGVTTSSIILPFNIAKRITPLEHQGLTSGFLNMFFGLIGSIFLLITGYLFQSENYSSHALFPVLGANVIACIIAIAINKFPEPGIEKV